MIADDGHCENLKCKNTLIILFLLKVINSESLQKSFIASKP